MHDDTKQWAARKFHEGMDILREPAVRKSLTTLVAGLSEGANMNGKVSLEGDALVLAATATAAIWSLVMLEGDTPDA